MKADVRAQDTKVKDYTSNIPMWRGIEKGCNLAHNHGGFARGGAETGVQILVSYAAWLFGVLFLLTLLNTVSVQSNFQF